MFRAMLGVWRGNEDGQDLADYCLLTALIALIALGIICHMSGGIQGIWSNAGAALAAGNATTGVDGAAGASSATTNQPAGR
jgi:Flp pilus assembly pilin Flp